MALRHEAGIFIGTAAALKVSLGFVPDWVKIRTIALTAEKAMEWNRNFRSIEAFGGIEIDEAGVTTPQALGAGIGAYLGGEEITSASTTHIARPADEDMRDKGTGDVVSQFTLDTPGNRTGHFNAGVNTTLVGVGSMVTIGSEAASRSENAVILAITNDGDAVDEVTLSLALSSGQVQALTGKNDLVGVPAGTITKAGFSLASDSSVNVSTEPVAFEAGTYN